MISIKYTSHWNKSQQIIFLIDAYHNNSSNQSLKIWCLASVNVGPLQKARISRQGGTTLTLGLLQFLPPGYLVVLIKQTVNRWILNTERVYVRVCRGCYHTPRSQITLHVHRKGWWKGLSQGHWVCFVWDLLILIVLFFIFELFDDLYGVLFLQLPDSQLRSLSGQILCHASCFHAFLL